MAVASGCVKVEVERPELVRHALAVALGRNVLHGFWTVEQREAVADVANVLDGSDADHAY